MIKSSALMIGFLFILLFLGCGSNEVGMKLHRGSSLGVDFRNDLVQEVGMNILDYMYFFNGGGVGAGDFNNDGLIDLYFAGNQKRDEIYINNGNLSFKKTTDISLEGADFGWSTGVSVVDVNNDGLLDIYVCELGNFNQIQGKNKLYICQGIKDGIPVYEDRAEEYGLDFSGFSTQAVFLDYDLDGDLDMFLLNHSIHKHGTFGRRSDYIEKSHPLSGDRMYRNDNGKFVDATASSGIYSNVLGYGLGIVISDLNNDGYPDIYIGNDFHENDYLYINQKNGSFKDEIDNYLNHTSRFSMGVDIADVNNDGLSEIMTLDMLPSDPYILKSSEGEDPVNTFKYKLGFGYNYQYARNMLQHNNGNGTFSEIGLFSNVYATDWSWSTLFADFNADGYKDIFVSNGIPKRMNDIDYINFISNHEVQKKSDLDQLDSRDMDLLNKIPEVKISNALFINDGQLKFQDIFANTDQKYQSYSNGTIIADLDLDGDLDIVTNNINDEVFIYENRFSKISNYLEIDIQGGSGNINAIGTKVYLLTDSDNILYHEKYPVRGFQSSFEGPIYLGLGENTIKNGWVVYPDDTYETFIPKSKNITLTYKPNLPEFDYSEIPQKEFYFQTKDYTDTFGLKMTHIENNFNEFDREPLIPHTCATEGPALAIGDINGDGLEDIFLGGSKRQPAQISIQQAGGTFINLHIDAIENDSIYEDIDAAIIDIDNDGDNDLIVASGGNEYKLTSEYNEPRLYLNDGLGNLTRKSEAFHELKLTAQVIRFLDVDGDGLKDIFLGARATPWNYGFAPDSYILRNRGDATFEDVSASIAPFLKGFGLITDAVVSDFDQDGDSDVVISAEWDGIYLFRNQNGSFEKEVLFSETGWWSAIAVEDLDGDGDHDIVCGNIGSNNKLNPNKEHPVNMFINDFDDNGVNEQILTYYLGNNETTFSYKKELETQIPKMKKDYLFAKDFASASFEELFKKEKWDSSKKLTVTKDESVILVNNDGEFEAIDLPDQVQWSPVKAIKLVNYNGDDLPDIFFGGNFYGNTIQLGRYDASFTGLLINKGNMNWEYQIPSENPIKGEIRKIKEIKINGEQYLTIGRNDDSLKILQLHKKQIL